jgi:hypothetical protein
MQQNNINHHSHHLGKSSAPLRQALSENFSEEFANLILQNPKINGVILEGPRLSSEMKSQILAIHLHGKEVRSQIAQSLLQTPEFRGKEGDELKRTAKIIRDKFNQVITPLMH